MRLLKYCFSLLVLVGLFMVSCQKEVEPEVLSLTSIEATGTSFEDGSTVTKDLNGVSSASDVALNSTITITFGREVDASTVNAANFSVSSEDTGEISASISSSGSVVTIDPDQDFERGTTYTLSLGTVKATDGGTFSASTRTFITEGRKPVVVPQADNMVAYWSFDGSADDAQGNYNPDNVVAIEFGEDRFGQGNSVAEFDGDESIIEVPNGNMLMEDNDFTLSFWMKTNSTDHVNENGDPSGNFVMGLGAFFGFQFEIPADFGSCKLAMSYETEDGTLTGEDLWFNGSGQDKDNGGWQGWDFVADLTNTGGVASYLKDRWVHVVCTYNATEKAGRMYFDGELMKSQNFNLWPDCDPAGSCKQATVGVAYRGNENDVEPILAIGFIKSIDSPMWADTPWGDYAKPTSNHFKGSLDDIRIFNAPFSSADVKTLYDSEKP